MSTITALNGQLMGKRTGLQIILQTLQRFHDQHTQSNFFERLIGVIQRPITSDTIANENRVDIDIIKNEIFSVPQPLYRYFTGREDVLQEIYDSLQSCSADGRPQQRKVTSITGDYGSGKTQLCCQFAERNRNSYGAVFWIDATKCSPERAQQPQRSTEQGNMKISTTLEQISTYEKPWLLIIDNIDNIEKLSEFFPVGDIGHILVTTKREPSNEMGHVIRLEGMNTEDAQGLLLMEAQRMKPWKRMELESANAIIETLRGESLPLALIQIARAVRNDLCSMEEYRQLLFQRLEEIRKELPGNENSSTSCLANIATMDIALYLMNKQKVISSQDAIKLLHVFSIFGSRRVPFETVQKAVLDSRSVKVKKNWWPRKASKRPGDECIWVQRRRWTIRMRKKGSHRGPILSRLEHLAACRTEWALMELIEMAF